MQPIVNIAVQAARKAGDFIRRSMEHKDRLEITTKSANDYVTQVDKTSEQLILELIQRSYPTHGFLCEESGGFEIERETVWIIDPLDGTTNFIHGYPNFAVSIGIMHRGQLEHGIVYQPYTDELFCASRNEGATLNSRRIHVSTRPTVAGSLLGTGFPHRDNKTLIEYLTSFAEIYHECGDIRRSGSAALDLCSVASGRLDGYWESNLQPWDIAAGTVIAREAGAKVTTFENDEDILEAETILAATPKVHEELLTFLDV